MKILVKDFIMKLIIVMKKFLIFNNRIKEDNIFL